MSFFLNFWRTKLCFGHLVMSPLDFKPIAGILVYTWQRHIHLWCNTCQPFGGHHGRLCQSLPHTCKQVHAGAQNQDLSCRRRKLSRLSCAGHESEPWKSEFCDLLKITLIFRDILAICCVIMRTSLEHEPRIKLQACLIVQGNVLHKTFKF